VGFCEGVVVGLSFWGETVVNWGGRDVEGFVEGGAGMADWHFDSKYLGYI
jgi:hypothetical protein